MIDYRRENYKINRAIRDALTEIFGDDNYVPGPTCSKLKDGRRVFRIPGSTPGQPGYLFKKSGDERVWCTNQPFDEHNPEKQPTPVDLRMWKWQWQIVHCGSDVIEQKLQAAMNQRIQGIDVHIGGTTANPISMSFVVNSVSANNGPPELVLLFSSLPSSGSVWAMEDRQRWLETARHMFDLMYKEDLC